MVDFNEWLRTAKEECAYCDSKLVTPVQDLANGNHEYLCGNCFDLKYNSGHLSLREKRIIQRLLFMGIKKQDIAEIIERSVSAVYLAANSDVGMIDEEIFNQWLKVKPERFYLIQKAKENKRSKRFTTEDVRIIKWMIEHDTQTNAALLFKVPLSTIRNITYGQSHGKIQPPSTEGEFLELLSNNIDQIKQREYKDYEKIAERYTNMANSYRARNPNDNAPPHNSLRLPIR
jgi:hypothetical protein